MSILNAEVYCGTYGKYAAGSIEGEWLRCADFPDKYSFLQACRRLHKDESDPEFMFQDWQFLPDSMVGESFISDDVFKVITALKKLSPERQEQFGQWCEDSGREPDLEAVREFTRDLPKPPKGDTWTVQAYNDYAAKYGDARAKSFMATVSGCMTLSNGGVVAYPKPGIMTSFCWGYSDFGQGLTYDEAHEAMRNFDAEHFVKRNLANFEQEWEQFMDVMCGRLKIYLHPVRDGIKVYEFIIVRDGEAPYYQDCEPATLADVARIMSLAQTEKAKFEKRLRSYVNRYGTSKLKLWTYWADE